MRRLAFFVLVCAPAFACKVTLPNKSDSVRFAVIGDNGTGLKPQYEVADQMLDCYKQFKYDFVIMNGDNLYGSQGPKDFENKFEKPYKALLDAGVKFYASLGNHDNPTQKSYKLFQMGGERFYSFVPKKGVRFLALDSNYMDKAQLEWMEKTLSNSDDKWKIAFFHHPLYSSGSSHGSDMSLRSVVEPMFVKHGVNVVFSGHDHFYERIKPQRGIAYFVEGSAGQLRVGNIRRSDITALGYDTDRTFMIVEIDGDEMRFQTVNRVGETIDSGVISRTALQQVSSAGGQ